MTGLRDSYPRQTVCPFCQTRNDVATAVGHDSGPEEGSVSICFQCSEPAFFKEDLTLRKPTPEETIDLAMDDDVQKLISAMEIVKAQKRK